MSADNSLAGRLLAGNRLALARAISLVENRTAEANELLAAIFPHTGRAQIIGITGAPGTGKSTLVTALAQSYRAQGLTVGIVAIDPTSPFSGGALLGDRVRMRALSGDSGVFMRSMATRGSLGGLALTTGDVIHLLDAAGFERILVETVGVGQAEVEIVSTAHSTLVVEAPGLGDEVQAIKAGILEIADILVVNKADRPGVDNTVRALEMMLELSMPIEAAHDGHQQQPSGLPTAQPTAQERVDWRVTVMKTVASNQEGIEPLRQRLDQHWQWLCQSGQVVVRQRRRVERNLENILRAEIERRIRAALPAGGMGEVIEAVQRREIDPYRAAARMMAQL